jgi:hypothetical protein
LPAKRILIFSLHSSKALTGDLVQGNKGESKEDGLPNYREPVLNCGCSLMFLRTEHPMLLPLLQEGNRA